MKRFFWTLGASILSAAALAVDIKLPPCGILVGHGVYNFPAYYPWGGGFVYNGWRGDELSPLEYTELIAKENQGNLVQYWWFSGGNRPQARANWLALEDLGIAIPPADWANMKNLTLDEFPCFAKHGNRVGAGMLKALKRCEELGLYSTMIYMWGAAPQYRNQITNCPHYIGYDFGEKFTFRFEGANTTREAARLDVIAKEFRDKVAAYVRQLKTDGLGNVMTTSSNFYLDYEAAAGVDLTMFEDCTGEINLATAISRGLCRQHGYGLWGAHIANEHYGWLSFRHPHRFETLKTQLEMKYLAGAKVLISESGAFEVQQSGMRSPQWDMPRSVKGGDGKSPTDADWAKHAVDAAKHYNDVGWKGDYCRAFRRQMSDFYDYVKKHGTPKGQPETTVALAKGNYDLAIIDYGGVDMNCAVAGLHTVAERDPRWRSAAPEYGWKIASDTFFPMAPDVYGDGTLNRLFTGTPYGQVDIVSFAFDQPTADFLLKNYKVLIFTGWNTCSEKQYRTLCDYVKGGGRLFISIPQLSTDVTRNFAAYTTNDLVRCGDFTELCGVRVRGRGPRFYWGVSPHMDKTKSWLGEDVSRWYGVFRGVLGDLEVTNPSAETLLLEHESDNPLLLRLKSGKGEVYFFNSWYYPGAYEHECGPGSKELGLGMVGAVWAQLAKDARTNVYVSEVGSDDPGRECRSVDWAHYPDERLVLLLNLDFARPHTIDVHVNGKATKVTLAPQEIRRLTY